MQIPWLTLARPKFASPASPRSDWKRWAARGIFLGVLLALLAEVTRVLFVGNVHTVMAGYAYRSAQLSADDLRSLIQKHGIRTVINLRGYCPPFDWYQDECQLDHDLNVSHEDVTLSANRLPPPTEIRRLIEVLDHTEYPVVFHCRQGADRTGLASAIYLLLYTNADYETARRQCGARYAHLPVLSTISMDRFFDQYEEWLRASSLVHTPANFRRWALHDYRPAPAPAQIDLLDPIPVLAPDEPLTVRVRVTNLSNVVWRFKPGTFAGVHIRYLVYGKDGQPGTTYRAGRFDAEVPPGKSIDLSLPFPPFREPGLYRISVDMAEKQLSFSQMSSEFLEFEVEVRDHQGR